MTSSSFVFGEACGCMVLCQGRESASKEELAAWLEAMARYLEASAKPRVLVITLGGAPNPEQRKKLDQLVGPNRDRIKFAIMTDSTFARGVVKANRLFYPFFQAFALKEMSDALRFLDVRAADVAELTRHAEGLRASLAT